MNWLKLLGVGATMAVLSACTGPGPSSLDITGPADVEAARSAGTPTAGTPFTQALTQEYRSFALDLYDRDKDWGNSFRFARRALQTGAGEALAPEGPADWAHLTAEQASELAAARTRLVGVLDGGARTQKPALAAKAQAAYECWMKNEDDGWVSGTNGWQTQNVAACKGLYAALMAELTAVPLPTPEVAVEQNFLVYFAWDSAALDAAANRVIDQAVTAAKKDNAARLTLVGHADLSGTVGYNLRLSLRRADAVRRALVARGIPSTRQSVTGVGDSEPAVPTARGVREPRNRFVSIDVK